MTLALKTKIEKKSTAKPKICLFITADVINILNIVHFLNFLNNVSETGSVSVIRSDGGKNSYSSGPNRPSLIPTVPTDDGNRSGVRNVSLEEERTRQCGQCR
jgi:hypothetical protein